MKNQLPYPLRSLLVLLLILASGHAFAAGGIRGTVTETNGGPAINCAVMVKQSNRTLISVITDFDGNYIAKPIAAGRYTIVFSYGKYKDSVVGVVVGKDLLTTVNKKMKVQPASLKEITMNRRMTKKPLVDYKASEGRVNSEKIVSYDKDEQMPIYRAAPSSMALSGSITYVNAPEGEKRQYYNPSTEEYKKDAENDFKSVKTSPLSTLSVDVDRASYSNIRRFINQGQKPPADAVRIEEMINYFDYNYPQPKDNAPVAITTEVTACPWNPENRLLHIGLQARKVNMDNLPASNLVFLIDVSGSMSEENKLPLLKSSFKLLVDNLREKDRVAIVVYAGNAGLVLPPTSGSNKTAINEALENLAAGGSTAGGEGIELAYKTAEEYFIKGGNNRIILATDGDFNVGVSNNNELEDLITKKRSKGIFLTCLGFGMGNYKDSKMEVLADKGNGNYAYIDNIQEARKTLVSEFGGTLFTVAKDVKAQVEFNPAKVQGYRLVGYENRLLNAEDFKDDTKDAGEMGAGHTVTILYEIIPTGVDSKWMRRTDDLKYQKPEHTYNAEDGELATVKFRYKAPDGNVSKELVHPIEDGHKTLLQTSENIRFAASVAMWGMLLKDSKYKGKASYENALLLAESARGNDREGYRAECIRLMKSIKN